MKTFENLIKSHGDYYLFSIKNYLRLNIWYYYFILNALLIHSSLLVGNSKMKRTYLSGSQKRKKKSEEKEKTCKLPRLTTWINSTSTASTSAAAG